MKTLILQFGMMLDRRDDRDASSVVRRKLQRGMQQLGFVAERRKRHEQLRLDHAFIKNQFDKFSAIVPTKQLFQLSNVFSFIHSTLIFSHLQHKVDFQVKGAL